MVGKYMMALALGVTNGVIAQNMSWANYTAPWSNASMWGNQTLWSNHTVWMNDSLSTTEMGEEMHYRNVTQPCCNGDPDGYVITDSGYFVVCNDHFMANETSDPQEICSFIGDGEIIVDLESYWIQNMGANATDPEVCTCQFRVYPDKENGTLADVEEGGNGPCEQSHLMSCCGEDRFDLLDWGHDGDWPSNDGNDTWTCAADGGALCMGMWEGEYRWHPDKIVSTEYEIGWWIEGEDMDDTMTMTYCMCHYVIDNCTMVSTMPDTTMESTEMESTMSSHGSMQTTMATDATEETHDMMTTTMGPTSATTDVNNRETTEGGDDSGVSMQSPSIIAFIMVIALAIF